MPVLVSPQWLSDNLHQVVVLDATLPPVGVKPAPDTHASYLEQHIPGAVFFDIDALSDPTSGLPHTLPAAGAFAAAMSALGVSSEATLVVYEQGPVFSAPRARWMLQTLGAIDVSILDRRPASLAQRGPAHRSPAPCTAIPAQLQMLSAGYRRCQDVRPDMRADAGHSTARLLDAPLRRPLHR